jgi:hypothetical protein
LVKAFLKAGILAEDGTLVDTSAGTPHGPGPRRRGEQSGALRDEPFNPAR